MLALVCACGGSHRDAPAVPPTVSTQPANLTVAVGSAATFSVTASGSAPLTYQWKRNGADIAGATSASYSIPATLLSDTRSKLSVTVRNVAGAATSTEANLYVTGIGVFAGQPGQAGTVDGEASVARFAGLAGLAIDKSGNLLATQSVGGALRKITPAGQVTTVATGLVGTPGLSSPFGSLQVAVDGVGNAYLTSGMSVVKLTPAGVATTFATVPECSGRGYSRCIPTGIALDSGSNVYVANNVSVRKFAPDGSYVLLEGSDSDIYPGTAFSTPKAMAFDGTAFIYVVDSLVRKIDAAGAFTVVAGGSSLGILDGTGSAAGFYSSTSGAAFDKAGNLYVTDSFSHIVRMVTPAGVVTTVAGARGPGGVLVGPLPGGLSNPTGIAVDANGDLYVNSGSAILKIQLPPR